MMLDGRLLNADEKRPNIPGDSMAKKNLPNNFLQLIDAAKRI